MSLVGAIIDIKNISYVKVYQNDANKKKCAAKKYKANKSDMLQNLPRIGALVTKSEEELLAMRKCAQPKMNIDCENE